MGRHFVQQEYRGAALLRERGMSQRHCDQQRLLLASRALRGWNALGGV